MDENFDYVVGNVIDVILDDVFDDVAADVEDGERENWTYVYVDIEGYRRMGDPSFQMHFRMTRTTFEELHETLRVYMRENGLLQREKTKLDIMMLRTLWVLATPDGFRSVALRFGVRPSTIHDHYVKIISVLCELAARYITWPSEAERNETKTAFQNYSGFPGIIGCVDGTHMVVTAPTIQPRRYVNRHHQYSFNVQVVYDHRLRVIDLYAGEAGALNDARVFRRSPLSKRLLTDPDMIGHDEHLVGDSIYMLTDKVIIPFRNNGHLTLQQREFNYRLCKCRTRVEHCFGKYFSQWRRLKFLQSFDVEYAVQTIVACFVLQNFMIMDGHEVPDVQLPFRGDDQEKEENLDGFDELEGEGLDLLQPNVIARHRMLRLLDEARRAGVEKREAILAFLQDNH